MPFDPGTWTIGWLLGRAAGRGWSFAFERSDAKKRLRRSVKKWTKDLSRDSHLSDFNEQALLTALFSPRDTASQKDMRNKLTGQTGVPSAELIYQALLDSWRQVRDESNGELQPFFALDEPLAGVHLYELAKLIYASCFEDAAQRDIFDNTQKLLDNVDEIRRMQQELLANRQDQPHVRRPYFMGEDAYTSQMATTDADLQRVLRLRTKHFGSKPIVKDDAYWACWRREPDSMKIVYDQSGKDLGYWSIFPVHEEIFRTFLRGELSHQQMLCEHVLRWEDVVGSDVFLYVVGVVVPGAGSYVSGRVLLDLFSFGIDLMDNLDIAGIFGYPSRDAGYEIFEHVGFAESSTIIDHDEGQPVFYVPETDGHLARVKHSFSAYVRKEFKRVPIWKEDDRRRFLDRLR